MFYPFISFFSLPIEEFFTAMLSLSVGWINASIRGLLVSQISVVVVVFQDLAVAMGGCCVSSADGGWGMFVSLVLVGAVISQVFGGRAG